jgi:hypothetical protein
MSKILKQLVAFSLSVCICICFDNLISRANTINFSLHNQFSDRAEKNSLISSLPSQDCAKLGTNQEKRSRLAQGIVHYMNSKSYKVSKGENEYNIIYIEGACPDGTSNADELDSYNDRRIILEFVNGEPKIKDHWLATSEPGKYYTDHPLNSRGAARIEFGQYKNTWRVGPHTGPSGYNTHEGLIQVGNVVVRRDINHDGKRTGDPIEKGNFGLNQHRGDGNPSKIIGRGSAGCLVGWDPTGHTDQFMDILKSDARYRKNSNYLFSTTIINGDDFSEKESIANSQSNEEPTSNNEESSNNDSTNNNE